MSTITIDRDDGTKLHCIDDGPRDGAPVVLAHGVLIDHRSWDVVRPALVKRGHRVILFDQRAHGRSAVGRDGCSTRAMASDYRAVFEHFDLKDAILVGHSMGAFLSVVFALEHPEVVRERLRGMVLVSGHAGDVAHNAWQNRIHLRLLRAGIVKVLMRSRRVARVFMRPLFGKRPSDALSEELRQILLRTHVPDVLPILDAMAADDHYPRLGEIDVPTHVICGDLDRTCPRVHSEAIASGIRGAKSTWLPRVAHMVLYEQPDVIIDAVAALCQPSRSSATAA